MKRKPDMLWLLIAILGLGIVTTGYTQVQWERAVPHNHAESALIR